MAKYNIVAYFLWLTMGWFGAHHFYLGRDHQGILWITSFGGLFGIGWFRDFYKIMSYVKEENGDQEFLYQLTRRMRQTKRPSVWRNIYRVVGQVMFGYFYRSLVSSSLPEEYSEGKVIQVLLLPLGTAFGTYMVSNIGSIKSSWKYSLLGAYVGEIGFGHAHLLLEESHSSLAVSISMVFSTFAWQYSRKPRGVNVIRGRGCCKRLVIWTSCVILFGSLLCSSIYFNGSVTTEEGETVRIREAMNNFFKSNYWKELKASFWKSAKEIWEEYRRGGWEGARERVIILSDIQGESRSRLILGVDANATMQEIKSRYRALAKEWHPDIHQGESAEAKVMVQEKFMEIKDAYETLQAIIKKREGRRSKTSRPHD